ncbi:MAG: c-type cytochrome [Kofleriaceae bacterium]|nr:c-type cytochrome [Kofleriaceae bacterium]
MRGFVGSGFWASITSSGVLLALSGSLLGACGTDIGMRDPSDDDGSGGEEVSGEELFRENCAMCHGADGGGSMDGPQILSPVKPFATYTVRTGRDKQMGFRDAMPAFGDDVLSDAELSRVLDFLAAAPKPSTGEGLYVRFCGNCHGANAQGGRVGQDVTHELDEVSEKVREGHGGTNYGARTKYMPSWTSAELTDAEVDLIAAYLATLPPGPGDDD